MHANDGVRSALDKLWVGGVAVWEGEEEAVQGGGRGLLEGEADAG